MDNETRLRIIKRAEVHANDEPYEFQAKESYIAGACAEHSRITELLKEERNKAIDECIKLIAGEPADQTLPSIKRNLESLKGKQQ